MRGNKITIGVLSWHFLTDVRRRPSWSSPLGVRLRRASFDGQDASASAQGLTRTAFVVQAAMEAAHRLLRDERLTSIAAAHGDAFMAWLDRPAEVLPNMKPLVDAPVLPHR